MEWLTRRYADMPLWVWATLAVGGFVVWRLQNANQQPQPVTFSGGELNQQPDPFGAFSLSSEDVVPVSAMNQTASSSKGSSDNSPTGSKLYGTGLLPTTGIPPGGKLPR